MKSFLFRQKYRLDQAMTLLVLVNFLLLVVAVSDKIMPLLGVTNTTWFTGLFSVGVLLALWVVGYLLEKKVKYQAFAEENVYKHSYIYRQLERRIDEVKDEVVSLKRGVRGASGE